MAKVDGYDGIIFDYGGVLVHHQSAADQARLAEVSGIPRETLLEWYWSDLRFDYDKGMPGIEFWRAIGASAKTTLNDEQIAELIEIDTVSWMNYDEAMWEWIEQLRAAGKRLAILSNMPHDLGNALRKRTRRFELFDHVTLSCEQKSAKPEPQIYQECLAGIGTAAEKTLFLDDRLPNIEAAEKLGIAGEQFTNSAEMLPLLR